MAMNLLTRSRPMLGKIQMASTAKQFAAVLPLRVSTPLQLSCRSLSFRSGGLQQQGRAALSKRSAGQGTGARRCCSSKAGSESGKAKSLWERYLELLSEKPLVTKAVTSAIIVASGDVMCQLAIEQNPELSVKRLIIFAILGGALVGPTLHYWYGILNKLVPAATSKGAIGRLCVDQFVFAPAFIAVFFGALLTLEGRPDQIGKTLTEGWFPAVKTNWIMWIPAQFINFRFVPLQLQVMFANVVALAWNSYLSWATHKAADDEADEKK